MECSTSSKHLLAPRPKLASQAPSWYEMPQPVKQAADTFDAIHFQRVEAAKASLADAAASSAAVFPFDPASRIFNARLREVRLNRFHVVTVLGEQQRFKGTIVDVRQKSDLVDSREFTVPKSIFGPRAIGSKDRAGYYDTEEKLASDALAFMKAKVAEHWG